MFAILMQVYVQHLMTSAANAQSIWRSILRGGYVYVCGATTMGSDVHAALKGIAESEGGKSRDEADTLLASMRDTGRYVQELWN